MSTERELTHSDEESRGSGARPELRPEVRPEIRVGKMEVYRGSGGGLLVSGGTIFILLATALLLVPTISPEQASIVRSLAERGVTSLPLYLCGLVFGGLWLVARTSQTHSVAAQRAALSNGPAIADMTGEISQLRDGLQALRIEFVYLKSAVQTQIDSAGTASSSDSQADAMYRLAASLDQVGQRLEEQIRSSQIEVRETLEDLSSSIEVSRLEGRDGRIHLGHEVDRRTEPVTDSNDAGNVYARRGTEEHELTASRDDSDSRERLGMLDLLDDLGRILPRKTSPDLGHPMITSDAFEGVQDEGWSRHESPAGPLPAPRRKDQVELRKAGLLASTLDESTDDTTVVTKLDELRALLADVRVRKALTKMDHLD